MGVVPSISLDLLFSAWRAGDRRAGDRLFAALHRKLRPYAEMLDPGGADDLLQDVLATFISCKDEFDVARGESRLLGWLRLALRRRSWARKARLSAGESAMDPDELPADDENEVERRLDAAARVRQLRALTDAETGVKPLMRRKTARLLDQIEEVLTEDGDAARTLGHLGKRVGLSAFQMSVTAQRLQRLVAPPAPLPAVAVPIEATAVVVAEVSMDAVPPASLVIVLDAPPRRARRAGPKARRQRRLAWRRRLVIPGGPGPPRRNNARAPP